MIGFEVAREAAARLHAEVADAGEGTVAPLAFAVAAARHLEVDVEWVPEGHDALCGAQAFFDAGVGTIVIERRGDEAERALRLAHELGHVELHAASSRCDEVDLRREAEAYGTRERRELEANVFARELLCPRDAARRMYLQDGLGAARIAARLALPLELVRRQLLEALLQPAPPRARDAARAPERTFVPDPAQEAAVAHRGSPFLLQAGPGTGKTETLCRRIDSLLAEGVPARSILSLTYSAQAARELAARVAGTLGARAEGIWIGTFHAFGLELVRRHHAELGLPNDPSVIDGNDAVEMLEDIVPTLPLVHFRNDWEPALIARELLEAIARAKDALLSPDECRARAEQERARAETPGEREDAERRLEVAIVYERYQRELQRRGAIDFGDQVMLPALLLERDEDVRERVRARHPHVLVDEYQDVNHASTRLLRALAGKGERLWVVGDALQAIYGFRGASPGNMARFPDLYPGALVRALDVSHRTSAELAACLVALASRMGASKRLPPLAMTARRGASGERPVVLRFETEQEEAEGVASRVEELLGRGVPLRAQAILCRRAIQMERIVAALARRGIPALHEGSLLDHEDVKDLLALMSLAVDRFGHGLPRVAGMPRYAVPLQDVHAVIQALASGEEPALVKLRGAAARAKLSTRGAQGLARLVADLDGIPAEANAWELLATYLLDRTDLLAHMAVGSSFEDRVRGLAVWELLAFVRGRGRIQETLDRIRTLVLLGEERALRAPIGALEVDAVRVMTIHASKGLEFEAVHVPGMAWGNVPSSYKTPRCPGPDDLVDVDAERVHGHGEESVLFVAASRAARFLFFYYPARAGATLRAPSPFLRWFAVEERAAPITPSPAVEAAASEEAIELRRPGGWQITAEQLEAYETCPKRYFYTHVLGLRGAWRATPFARTHACVHDLVRWSSSREAPPAMAELEAELARLWKEKGLSDHAHADAYWAVAQRLVAALHEAGVSGRRVLRRMPLVAELANGRIAAWPHEVVEEPDGSLVLRRLRTGGSRHPRRDAALVAAYLVAAARRKLGRRVRVEIVNLTDGEPVRVSSTPHELARGEAKLETILANIRAGRFPARPGAVVCARCPHLFACGAVPAGPLEPV